MAMRSDLQVANRAPWEDRHPVTRAPEPVPCVVTVHFTDGSSGEAVATAVAWSPRAVEVRFVHPVPGVGIEYRVWLPAGDVRRRPK